MASKSRMRVGDDGRPANVVGKWAIEKHERVRRYTGITSSVRRKFLTGQSKSAAYVELYCATGRSYIEDTDEFVEGSPLIAWRESVAKNAPFSEVIIADANPEHAKICRDRLLEAGAPVTMLSGVAEKTVHEACELLNPHGYHFAFIDPYSLKSLPFSIIDALCTIKRIDLLIHVSSQDLQRNFGGFITGALDGLDEFAPGWRDVITNDTPQRQRHAVLEYWKHLISQSGGKRTAEGIERITGPKNIHLYWLVLASGHPRAEEFWDKVRRTESQIDLF